MPSAAHQPAAPRLQPNRLQASRRRQRIGHHNQRLAPRPKRFHGSITLDANRVGRDAGKIAEEVISHLVGLVGANVTVSLEITAEVPDGAPDHVVRTVTENARTLKFEPGSGFEKE